MRSRSETMPAAIDGASGRSSLASSAFQPAGEGSPDVIASFSPFARSSWGLFLAAMYPLLVVTPLAIFVALTTHADHSLAAEIGVDCALVGITIVALQFLITARLSWVEAPFGLDVLLAFHRAMALVATGLLCAHPILVASAEGWPLLTRLHVHWYIWAGRVALLLLLVHVTVSFYRRAWRLSYEAWRRIHHFFAPTILVLGCTHAMSAGSDGLGAGRVVWAAMMAAALGCWIYGRVIRPWRLSRHPFHVTAVEAAAPRVWTLTLKSQSRPFLFAPGQFQFLRVHTAGVPAEEHPFTIASSPTETDGIRLTIKESGDFTAFMRRVRPGDRATVHGPFGRFSYLLHPDQRELVFVAAGVGITPLMSMLRYMRERRESRVVLLLFANKSPADALFAEELHEMEMGAYPTLKVVHVFSSAPPSRIAETGRIDADRLARLCGSLENKAFYLCCPGPMMAALVGGLRRMGVSPRCIHADWFSL